MKVEAGPGLTMKAFRNEISQLLDRHRDNPRLVMVDPLSVICERGYCYLVRNGQPNFRDTAHISNVNASQYSGIFDAASSRRGEPEMKHTKRRTDNQSRTV